MAGRTVRHPDRVMAVQDHDVPTTDRSKPIEDPIARKKATDAFVKMARMNMSTTSTYADIQAAIGNNGKKANDSKPIVADADYDHGMDIAKRFNPHYMKEGK